MKDPLMLIPALVLCMPLHAQEEKLGTYGMLHFEKTYDISATERGAFLIDCAAINAPDVQGGITVDGEDIEAFRSTLARARERYLEWSRAATEAGTTTLEKRMELISPKIDCYFHHEGQRIDSFSKKMSFKFKVEGGKHLLIGTTGPVTSTDAPSVKLTGMTVVFSSTEEVDALLAGIDPQKAAEHFARKKGAVRSQ